VCDWWPAVRWANISGACGSAPEHQRDCSAPRPPQQPPDLPLLAVREETTRPMLTAKRWSDHHCSGKHGPGNVVPRTASRGNIGSTYQRSREQADARSILIMRVQVRQHRRAHQRGALELLATVQRVAVLEQPHVVCKTASTTLATRVISRTVMHKLLSRAVSCNETTTVTHGDHHMQPPNSRLASRWC